MSDGERRVLVVDDDPSCRLMLASLVAKAGFTVDSVADGDMALTLMRAHPPDIVLLDAHLPGMDGWRVCETIKARGSTPVVMLTAFASDEAHARTVQAGADEFVPKPFRADHLLSLMRNLLGT